VTDEAEQPENDFAAFEAAATAEDKPAPEPEAKAPVAEPDEEDDVEDADDTNVNDQAEEDKDEEPKEEGKRRSKPAHQRIAELTAKLRQAERDLETARKPADEKVDTPVTTLAKPDPNAKNADGSDKYEFGEADPEYLADLTDWKVEDKLAQRDAKTAEDQRAAKVKEMTTGLDTAWQEKATAAVDRYPDFNKVVLESAAAGDWECGPIVAIAISASDQGADIAYHLASNPKEAAELNKIAQTDPMEAARRFGRLEARFEAKSETKAPAKLTEAPEPPQHRARGGSGKFEVDGSTTDFAAFEAKVASGRR
jgi:hypothetical protein